MVLCQMVRCLSLKKSRQPKGASETMMLSHDEFKQACMYVLQNCEEVSQFMEQFFY